MPNDVDVRDGNAWLVSHSIFLVCVLLFVFRDQGAGECVEASQAVLGQQQRQGEA